MAWSRFLLRNIDPDLLSRLIKDAKAEGRSLSDYIRAVLCDHYLMDCPPSAAPTRLEFGATTLLLRLQPELFTEIRADADSRKMSMRLVIFEILEARYAVTS